VIALIIVGISFVATALVIVMFLIKNTHI